MPETSTVLWLQHLQHADEEVRKVRAIVQYVQNETSYRASLSMKSNDLRSDVEESKNESAKLRLNGPEDRGCAIVWTWPNAKLNGTNVASG